jgi:hypothetical protein
MKADIVPLLTGVIVFVSSLISLKLGLSVAIIEILFGAIASLFGLTSGFVNQTQYSVLVGVVIASAVIPTFIAQKWSLPVHTEDIIESNGETGGSQP